MTLDEIEKKYDVILADPPWKYRNWSKRGEGKGAAGQYDTMAVDDIMRLPVGNIAAKDSVLFMWVTPCFQRRAGASKGTMLEGRRPVFNV